MSKLSYGFAGSLIDYAYQNWASPLKMALLTSVNGTSLSGEVTAAGYVRDTLANGSWSENNAGSGVVYMQYDASVSFGINTSGSSYTVAGTALLDNNDSVLAVTALTTPITCKDGERVRIPSGSLRFRIRTDITTGSGVPKGGTNNQVLVKIGSNDYVASWEDASIAIGSGADIELANVTGINPDGTLNTADEGNILNFTSSTFITDTDRVALITDKNKNRVAIGVERASGAGSSAFIKSVYQATNGYPIYADNDAILTSESLYTDAGWSYIPNMNLWNSGLGMLGTTYIDISWVTADSLNLLGYGTDALVSPYKVWVPSSGTIVDHGLFVYNTAQHYQASPYRDVNDLYAARTRVGFDYIDLYKWDKVAHAWEVSPARTIPVPPKTNSASVNWFGSPVVVNSGVNNDSYGPNIYYGPFFRWQDKVATFWAELVNNANSKAVLKIYIATVKDDNSGWDSTLVATGAPAAAGVNAGSQINYLQVLAVGKNRGAALLRASYYDYTGGALQTKHVIIAGMETATPAATSPVGTLGGSVGFKIDDQGNVACQGKVLTGSSWTTTSNADMSYTRVDKYTLATTTYEFTNLVAPYEDHSSAVGKYRDKQWGVDIHNNEVYFSGIVKRSAANNGAAGDNWRQVVFKVVDNSAISAIADTPVGTVQAGSFSVNTSSYVSSGSVTVPSDNNTVIAVHHPYATSGIDTSPKPTIIHRINI